MFHTIDSHSLPCKSGFSIYASLGKASDDIICVLEFLLLLYETKTKWLFAMPNTNS